MSRNEKLDSQDWKKRIQNEIEALTEIYLDAFKILISTRKIQVKLIPNSSDLYLKSHPKHMVKLQFEYQDNYPKVPPKIKIYKTYNIKNDDRKEINSIITSISTECQNNNMEMVHTICTEIQNYLNNKVKQSEKLNLSLNSNDNLSDNDETNKIHLYKRGKNDLKAFENIRDAMLTNKINNSEDSPSLELDINSRKSSEGSNEKNENNDNNNYIRKFSGENNGNNVSYSRFKSDFTILSKLGQGGGGCVFKVQNHWDKMVYAIKRIKVHLTKKGDLNLILNTVRSEGYVLSRLQSPFIVRYFQTWVEEYNEEDYQDEKDDDEYEYQNPEENESDEGNQIEGKGRKLSFEKKNTSLIEDKDELNTVNNNSFTNEYVLYNNVPNLWDEDDNQEEEEEEIETKKNKKKVKFIEDDSSEKKRKRKEETKKRMRTLYIQMEFCEGKTLREAIDNKTLTIEQKWKLITQILEAVSFIHSKKLIHRDIKPGNIFLDANYNVKLGDFGLAKITKAKTQLDDLIQSTGKKEVFHISENELMTIAIGTKYYCSPEQEMSKKYNFKSDMFSIGIIIFEMFYQFNSQMERGIVLRTIKERHTFPEDFSAIADENVVQIVKMLTESNPNLRPSSEELLNSTLIPIVLDEQRILENFNKIIDENTNLSDKFLEILIEKRLKQLTKTNNKKQSKKPNDDNFFKSYQSFQLNLLDTFVSKSISPTDTFFIYETIQKKIKDTLHELKAFYTRIGEIETYKQQTHDTNSEEIENIMLTKSSNVLSRSKNVFNNLSKIIARVCRTSKLRTNYFPIKFYTDNISMSFCQDIKSNVNQIEYHDITYISLWQDSFKNSKILNDCNEKYIVDSLIVVFKILEKIETFSPKNLLFRINSSKILDLIFQKLLGKRENNNEVKMESLYRMSQILNQRERNITQKEFQKIALKKKCNFPISKDKIENLISMLMISGDIESIKKKFEKKDLNDEICKICNLFNKGLYWKKNSYPYRYKNQIKIDFSFIPLDLAFYNGIFMQVCFKEDNNRIPLMECGSIDNYFANESNETNQNHGFAIRIFVENFCQIEEIRMKDKIYRIHALIITTFEVNENVFREIQEKFTGQLIDYEILFKPQIIEEFDDYYNLFQMKYLIIIKKDKGKNDEQLVYQVDSKEKSQVCKNVGEVGDIIKFGMIKKTKEN